MSEPMKATQRHRMRSQRASRRGRYGYRRSGLTMIELLGVIAVTAMLFSVVMTLFAAAYRVEASWRDEASQANELQRLAAYFREDAHQADDLKIAEGNDSWSFSLPGDRRVDYALMGEARMGEKLAGGAVERVERGGSGGQPDQRRRQELSLPEGTAVTVQKMNLFERSLVTLLVELPAGENDSRSPVIRVDARLGQGRIAATDVPLSPEGN